MPRNRKRWRALALTTVLLGHTAVFLAVLRADRDRRITALPTERAAPMLIRLAARIPGIATATAGSTPNDRRGCCAAA